MSQALYIVLGFLILFTLNFSITGIFMMFYLLIAREQMERKQKFLMILYLSIANCALQILMLMFSGLLSNQIAYFVGTFLLSFVSYGSILYFVYKFKIVEIVMIAAMLSMIVNPIWFRFFGVL